MGGQIGQDLAQVGMGFAARMGELTMQDRLKQKQMKEDYTLKGIQQLASMGELDNMDEGMLKRAQQLLGKDNFALAMQQSNLNRAIGRARQGASNYITQDTTTQPAYGVGAAMPGAAQGMQGPPTAEQVAAIPNVTITKETTPEQAFERMNQIGPLGTYLLTGNVQAGQLAQQQGQLAFDRLKNAQAPGRALAEELDKLEIDAVKNNRRFMKVDPNQIDSLNQTGVPEGFVAYKVGQGKNQIGILMEMPMDAMEVSEGVRDQLRARGVRDVRRVSDKVYNQALDAALKKSEFLAGSSARGKQQIIEGFKDSQPMLFSEPQAAVRTWDREAGRHIENNVTRGMAKEKRYVTLGEKEDKAMNDLVQSMPTLENTMQLSQKIWGQGGALAGVQPGFFNRFKGGVKAWWKTQGQTDPDVAQFAANAGQMAQLLNRLSFGGVGQQTENDRKFSRKMLGELSDGTFFADTPEVVQQKMNSLVDRINKVQGSILGVRDFVAPGTYKMDITKTADQVGYVKEPYDYRKEQAQQAQQPQAMQGEQQQQEFSPGRGAGDFNQIRQNFGVGALSVSEESAGDPGVIGNEPDGSKSYGAFQINDQNIPEFIQFVAQQVPQAAQALSQAQPGTPQFDQMWKQAAQQYPQQFAQLQTAYAGEKFFKPAMNAFTRITGIQEVSEPIQQAIFSTGIQHGRYDKVFQGMSKYIPKGQQTPADIAKALYASRLEYIDSLPEKTLPQKSKDVIEKRYEREISKVLEMLQNG